MPDTIPLAPILAALGIMLGASLVVERFLTIIAWVVDRLYLMWKATQNQPGESLARRIPLLEKALAEDQALRTETPDDDDEREIPPNGKENPPIEPFEITDEKAVIKEFWLQILGVLVGAAACYYTRFSVWQLLDWLPGIDAGTPQFWEYWLTGVMIGAGSKPVHFLMKFLLERKIQVPGGAVTKDQSGETQLSPPEEDKAPQPGTAEPSSPTPVVDIPGFSYDGGYQPQRLAYTHLRQRPIDMIIIHHTAMHADAPFEAIVAEFERKNWLAGYHSIVFKDGTVRTFTRWDRMGSHTRGYNSRSLGIAFHGNFEPDPAVPFSNPDGRMGILVPTAAQLEAGARVIAWWVLLYGVPLDFQKHIVPHRQLAPKACPGSNFPLSALADRVQQLVTEWQENPRVLARVEQFKHFPYVT